MSLKVIKSVSRYATLGLIAMELSGCGTTDTGNTLLPQTIRFSADFESGNLPTVKKLDQQGLAWELALRNDNDDSRLPNSFRTWWYLRADNIPIQQHIRLEFTRLGFPYYFVPVFSYDNKTWHYFDEQEVSLLPGCNIAVPDSCRLVISKQFTANTVWIARTFPYTTQDLSHFLATVSASPYMSMSTLGFSPRFKKPLQLLTLSDNTSGLPKKTVWIHARTHPAETGPSFLLEGFIRAALAEDALGRTLRQRYIVKIMPMLNVDGVILGNYRTNATSINLENQWVFSPGSPYLNEQAPVENRLVNTGAMVPALSAQTTPVVLALNLHSSNEAPDTAAFFFPHFGSDPQLYTVAQQNLWKKQLNFIKLVAKHYDGRIERPPVDGGSKFLRSFYPETWWWTNTEDAVNAITLETTYGRAGFDHWVTQDDLRNLGIAVAKAIKDMDQLPQDLGSDDVVKEHMPVFRLPFKPEIYAREDEAIQ